MTDQDDDIVRYEVSEDGVTWRPYSPRDAGAQLHTRIEFAPIDDDTQPARLRPRGFGEAAFAPRV